MSQDNNVFVPNFIDPESRIENPNLEGIDRLRFLTTDDFPPFNYISPDGKIVGFHVDLAKDICEILGIQCSIQIRPWDTLVASVTGEGQNAIIAGLAVTAEGRNALSFTQRYFSTPARFVGLRSQTGSPGDDLEGKKIGIVEGSAHARFVRAYFPKARLLDFSSLGGAQIALKNQVVDLVFGDAIALSFWLNGADAAECCRFVGEAFEDQAFFGEGFRIAVDGSNERLLEALDFALARIQSTGRYRVLYLKHFPIGIY